MSAFSVERTDRVCCIGAGYVGTPTMVMIATQCPAVTVSVVDMDESRISAWNSEKAEDFPIFEPGLSDLVFKCRDRNLTFSTNIAQAIDACDVIFVCVNTPTKTSGLGAGRAANLGPWESAGRMIAKYSRSNKIVVEKSTVPVRTAEALASVLSDTNVKSNPKFVILSNPEFLAEGSAISDLADPDRVLIGGPQNEEGQYAIGVLKKIYSNWIDESRIITANLWSSELSKLVANAFLAQRVSSINSIAMLCERTGADIAEVALAVGSDSRIGNKFLQASVGFGGSCFKKDIFNLVYLCEQLGLNHVAEYWLQVVTMNEVRKTSFVETIVTCMFNTVDAKILTIFGFAFKKNTCDTRESPAISVCQDLLNEGAVLKIYDPKVSSYAIERELGEKPFKCVDSPKQAVQDSHAIIILTEWDEFATLDYALLYERMQKPAFFFDGRNLNSLDHKQLAKIGFRVKAVGKPHF